VGSIRENIENRGEWSPCVVARQIMVFLLPCSWATSL
jgi:hypothetical protein